MMIHAGCPAQAGIPRTRRGPLRYIKRVAIKRGSPRPRHRRHPRPCRARPERLPCVGRDRAASRRSPKRRRWSSFRAMPKGADLHRCHAIGARNTGDVPVQRERPPGRPRRPVAGRRGSVVSAPMRPRHRGPFQNEPPERRTLRALDPRLRSCRSPTPQRRRSARWAARRKLESRTGIWPAPY